MISARDKLFLLDGDHYLIPVIDPQRKPSGQFSQHVGVSKSVDILEFDNFEDMGVSFLCQNSPFLFRRFSESFATPTGLTPGFARAHLG